MALYRCDCGATFQGRSNRYNFKSGCDRCAALKEAGMRKVKTHYEVRKHKAYAPRDEEGVEVTCFGETDLVKARLSAISSGLCVGNGSRDAWKKVELVKVETHEGEPEVFDKDRSNTALLGA